MQKVQNSDSRNFRICDEFCKKFKIQIHESATIHDCAAWLKWSWNLKFLRYLVPDRCVKERPRRALNWPQTMAMFYLPLSGMIFGFAALIYEISHYKTVKRFVWSSSGPRRTHEQRVKCLILEYDVKTIVDGIYEDTGDIWVCFSPRKMRPRSRSCEGNFDADRGNRKSTIFFI